MSSSSELLAAPLFPMEDGARLLARILAGIAFECAAMANEIADLGASISGVDVVSGTEPAMIVRLQAFDRITQSAHAQAQIIAHVARDLLMVRAPDRDYMLSMIDGIPLYDVRARLRESISGLPMPSGLQANDDPEVWSDATC